MPRGTSIRQPGKFPIPKDMDRLSFKVEIITSSGTSDITNFVTGDINRLATEGLSTFSLEMDNNNGIFKDKFAAGDIVNIYYDFASTATTLRFRGYIDGVYDNFNISTGFVISIEGRDAPKSNTNEHFGDTEITIQFTSRNNLDCWFGTTGDTDPQGNFANGVLYNSGLILRVFDTSDETFKNYKDLSEAQRDTLKSQQGYTQTHTNLYVDKTRLAISKPIAIEGDYDFRIEFDSVSEDSFLIVHPEEAILNSSEAVTLGQNLLNLGRFGKDTATESNRIKEKGFTDGTIVTMNSKQNIARQSVLWIKDKNETNSTLQTDTELGNKATARLNELKEAKKKGSMATAGLPTLQPAEKIPLTIPYVFSGNIKIKSFAVIFGADFEFQLDLQDRETRFERIFKDRIDENVNVTPTDNPNGMRNAFVFDFSNPSDYILDNCEIKDGVLTLSDNQITGKCTTRRGLVITDEDITQFELRVKANQIKNCTYRASSKDTGFEVISLFSVHDFSSVGKRPRVEITLNESTPGVSPEFSKLNLLSK